MILESIFIFVRKNAPKTGKNVCRFPPLAQGEYGCARRGKSRDNMKTAVEKQQAGKAKT
jgi:hypothetical protein